MKHQPETSDRLTPQNESLKKGDNDVKQTAPEDVFSVDNGEMEKEIEKNNESSKGREKYLREVADIEGLPDEEPVKEDSPEAKNTNSR